MSIAPAPRPSRALGIWALVCAILAPVWLFAGFYLVIFAMADTAPVALVVLANIAALVVLLLAAVLIVVFVSVSFGAFS